MKYKTYTKGQHILDDRDCSLLYFHLLQQRITQFLGSNKVKKQNSIEI